MARTQQPVMFACLARDCAATIGNLLSTMDGLQHAGIACRAIVGENGSKDGTRAMIESQHFAQVQLLDTSSIANFSVRLERIAHGRELVARAVRESCDPGSYVCVADVDDVLSAPIAAESIKAALAVLDERADILAASATSSPWYYDLLAYRSETLDFSGLEAEFLMRKSRPIEYYEFHRKIVYPAQRAITQAGTHLAISAFNGLCVYRAVDYVRGSYIEMSDFTACEHVVFNRSVQRDSGRRILVMEALRLAMPPSHGPATFWHFYASRVSRKIKMAIPL